MNRAKSQLTVWRQKHCALTLIGALSCSLLAAGCSDKSKAALRFAQPQTNATMRPAVLPLKASSASTNVKPNSVTLDETKPKPSAAKPITYRSRDYGVSFVYPWQYAYKSAKAMAEGDASLKPKTDGSQDQFTLVRIDIPKGFYPDTDFDSGYFMLSLNQDLDQQGCAATLGTPNTEKQQTENINGVDFRWIETDNGGQGNTAKLRNYAAFANNICYEIEMGVKTKNQQGLAREINPDRVFQRLEAILKTVKINQAMENTSAPLMSSQQTAIDTQQ
jgi:hypothetical protein